MVTRLPLDDRNVVGVARPPYPPHTGCAAPGCGRFSAVPHERHHLWRRSFLNGDYWWVRLPNGEVVGNIVWLCNEHHRQVTENKARIRYDETGGFTWETRDVDGTALLRGQIFDSLRGRLDPQPPVAVSHDCVPTSEQVCAALDAQQTPSGSGTRHLEPGHECPTCQRRVPYPKKESSPKTKVVSYRTPEGTAEQHEEVMVSAAKHIGCYDQPFWRAEVALRGAVLLLQEPGAHEKEAA